MLYSRDIKDRVAEDDNCFVLEQLPGGKIKLIPSPTSVTEVGTDVNKALLQPIEDRVVWLMNKIYDDFSSNPFYVSFDTIDDLMVEGIWNESLDRIEC